MGSIIKVWLLQSPTPRDSRQSIRSFGFGHRFPVGNPIHQYDQLRKSSPIRLKAGHRRGFYVMGWAGGMADWTIIPSDRTHSNQTSSSLKKGVCPKGAFSTPRKVKFSQSTLSCQRTLSWGYLLICKLVRTERSLCRCWPKSVVQEYFGIAGHTGIPEMHAYLEHAIPSRNKDGWHPTRRLESSGQTIPKFVRWWMAQLWGIAFLILAMYPSVRLRFRQTEARYKYNRNLATYDPEKTWTTLDLEKKRESIARLKSMYDERNMKWGLQAAEWILQSLHLSAMKTHKNRKMKQLPGSSISTYLAPKPLLGADLDSRWAQ